MKNVEIPKWLERLPMAPEFHPTDTEFADPIAYISKIEKEASAFGICKVIPPLPKPSRKYVLHNLNKSLSKCPELDLDVNLVKTDSGARNNCDRTVNAGERRAVFTTRHQQLGCEKGKKAKGAVGDQVSGAQKQVWQSGEVYTLEQFEAKAKIFAKSQLGIVKEVNPLVIETMFWKAASEKPVYVEYANDVPGSGFSEPEGLLRYFDRRSRRRRKRNSFDRNNVGNSDSKNDQVDSVVNSTCNNNDAGIKISPSSCTEITLNSLQSQQSHHHASFSGRKDSQESSEMEGTAGWKLSNSPWNLQVIARSPGSLTRFMPDDIPGVTSPMVYIGMLFSWFAWHVEDHELHSMNFLHMGSPKTWYAVPGDYAFQFEEATRRHVYGENSDRLVALSLLGEKTTVLSPEVMLASGIPCCRLVQYPGEFVVTFPRAYHIGFSHGFNCGEAANFGTSKWLTIAKEAAVRRAAMNFLPMLSHQQLLHLLTMSFISRIPRSLLPGVRSSRLRDRLKEERELSVKRAFIEDILHENSRVTILLQRNSSFHAVLWDVDSLPSSTKESELCKNGDTSVVTSVAEDSPKNDVNLHDVDQLSNYISAGCLDFDDDDLAYDFQMESGTLPCVACGILGFPFMAVVQPSEAAAINLMDLDNMVDSSTKDATGKAKVDRKDLSHENRASLGAEKSQSTHSSMEQSPIPDCSASLHHQAVSSTINCAKGWKISNTCLKPRIFCLEHAIEIEELLRSRGGANILVICHSDFQKIKTHAAVIAEEIAVPFRYTEIPLGDASPEDLNLIDIAIDREDHATSAEDWTSLLNINLQHCVKVKRSSPSLNVEHLLSLGGLFSDATPVPKVSSVKWLARKFRSKRLSKRLLQNKSSDSSEIVEEDRMAKKDVKLIQYSRKRFKGCSSEIRAAVETNDVVIHGISDTNTEVPDIEDKTEKNGKTFSAPSELPFDGNSEIQSEHVENSFESHSVNPVIENVEAETRILQEKDEVVGSCSDETLREEETENEAADVARTGCDMSAENDSATKEASATDDSSNCSDDDEQIKTLSDQSKNSEESKSSSSEGEQHIQTDGEDDDDDDGRTVVSQENKASDDRSTIEQSKSTAKTGNKRKREVSPQLEDQFHFNGFIRGPCEGLRPRARQVSSSPIIEDEPTVKKSRKPADNPVPRKNKKENPKGRYKCEIEGCTMSFRTKAELQLHEANRCPVEGCRKKFNSHKYALQHQRVHDDDRPLKCSWDGCTMSFKWAWARTEHLRVHTGERPYMCKVKGCGLTFRFVSDFSRHRRKTGHYVSPPAK